MTRLLQQVKTHWMAIALTLLATITLLSLWPLQNLPPIPGTDKTHHLIAYTALMFPVALRKPQGWLLMGLGFVVYSGAIELLQPYVNRYGEWLDLAANTAGIVCGAVLAELTSRLLLKRDS